MSSTVPLELSSVLKKIDRPGSFCVSGSAPTVLPGLEVDGLGSIALPLTTKQAKELKKQCEQAPYGKGEETIVDTDVRRVWRMKPGQFSLTNPDWDSFLKQTVKKVQLELGLESQKLEATLYDLLLYEKGSFFLPHRDGQKQDRMVATLVIVLPSSFTGGELIVRHDGQEKTIDFGGSDNNLFHIHFAAFYADCEHEVRPLQAGYRLCLVYNLTLTKAKKTLGAPRNADNVEACSQILREWAKDEKNRRLAVTLEHQYTQEGLTWDALKGVDRVKASVLLEAARQADCQVHLALLTLHESGEAADDGYSYGRHRRWGRYSDPEPSDGHTMAEVYETTLTADHWSDSDGHRLGFGEIPIKEAEILDPEAIREVTPEEECSGYTGNEGMPLDFWYRLAALFIWPNRRHFDILCDAGTATAVSAIQRLVAKWRQSSQSSATALKTQCVDFASSIIAHWPEKKYFRHYSQREETPPLLPSLVALGEGDLITAYLGQVLSRDASADPGETLLEVCQQDGWTTYQPELESVFTASTNETIERNIRMLEPLCLAKPGKKKGWSELCEALASAIVHSLPAIDKEPGGFDFNGRKVDRAQLLTGLVRSLIATEQFVLLAQVVEHVLTMPKCYLLVEVQVAALLTLQPWLAKHLKKRCPPLSHWLAACREQLESLPAMEPKAPADFRRDADLSCKCADCAELKRFLHDPVEKEHRFRMAETRRKHLQNNISHNGCDLTCKTDRTGSPQTLVCTKNSASYEKKLKKYHQDQEHLASVRAIEARLAK